MNTEHSMERDLDPASLGRLLHERASLLARLGKIDEELLGYGLLPATPPPRARPYRDAILAALVGGPLGTTALAARTGQNLHALQEYLSTMMRAGEVRRVGRGLYALPAQG